MSEKAPLRVVVTGAAGQIAYSLLYQIASGYVFGEDQVRDRPILSKRFAHFKKRFMFIKF
jgi:hypothetical protein